MNPVEEFLMLKQATVPRQAGTFGQIGNFMAEGLGAGLGAAILTGGALAAKHIYNAATAKRDFKEMLHWNQDLHQADQSLLNQSFRTLRRFAPDMAQDPLVAGSMVRRMVQAPEGAAGIIGEAISGQGRMPEHLLEAYTSGVQSGVGKGVGTFQPFGLPPSTVPWTKAHELQSQMAERERMHEQKAHQQRELHTIEQGRRAEELASTKKELGAAQQRGKTLKGYIQREMLHR